MAFLFRSSSGPLHNESVKLTALFWNTVGAGLFFGSIVAGLFIRGAPGYVLSGPSGHAIEVALLGNL
jgi:hypothetical protein